MQAQHLDPLAAAAVAAVLRAIPAQHRAALGPLGRGENYILCDPHELRHQAEAGVDTVTLRTDLVQRYGDAATRATVAHELAHVALRHYERLQRDPRLRDALEDEADRLARVWVGDADMAELDRHRR